MRKLFQKQCFHGETLCLQEAVALQLQFLCQNKEMKLSSHDGPSLNPCCRQ